jgi:GAF domain-containing protein
VGDTRAGPLLVANRAVTEVGVRACAGIPLVDLQGVAFGTLAVLEIMVRDCDDSQLAVLVRLAELAADICLRQIAPSRSKEGSSGVASPTP